MPIRPDSKLDETARSFLGGGSGAKIEVHEGQEADEQKLLEQQERALLAEACDYGDDLVRYVAMHRDLSPEEAAWGFCLGLYCARNAYPEGGEEFDDIADQANKDLVLAKTTVITDQAEIDRIQTELPQFDDASFKKAATFAENVASFLQRKKQQLGIANKQGTYGLGRAFHNLRQTFPTANGGSAAFDELARRAGVYFAENKE
jgi:hypothetical protein